MQIGETFDVDGIDWLKPIANGIYHWGDTPFFGLHEIQHLDLESKRKELFGRCEIIRCINPNLPIEAVVFGVYVDIDHPDLHMEKIFLPVYLLKYADHLRQMFPQDIEWPDYRDYDFCCAMARPRYPRIVASCWMANHSKEFKFLHSQNWQPSATEQTLFELLQIGGFKDWTDSWGPDCIQMPYVYYPDQADWDKPAKFQILYKNLYHNAAAGIVIGAISWEWASELCEKYLFAVYSGCIPIVHGYKIYERLEKIGFDTFSDVIDTSSQYDKNLIRATWSLFDKNQKFFTQARDIIQRPDIKKRLKNNIRVAKNIGALYRNSLKNLNSPSALAIFDQNKKQIWQFFQGHHLDFESYE